MKEKYTIPEMKVEELAKTDVLCDSLEKNYNVNGTFNSVFKILNVGDLEGIL